MHAFHVCFGISLVDKLSAWLFAVVPPNWIIVCCLFQEVLELHFHFIAMMSLSHLVLALCWKCMDFMLNCTWDCPYEKLLQCHLKLLQCHLLQNLPHSYSWSGTLRHGIRKFILNSTSYNVAIHITHTWTLIRVSLDTPLGGEPEQALN